MTTQSKESSVDCCPGCGHNEARTESGFCLAYVPKDSGDNTCGHRCTFPTSNVAATRTVDDLIDANLDSERISASDLNVTINTTDEAEAGEAPERIWIDAEPDSRRWHYNNPRNDASVQYVRADLARVYSPTVDEKCRECSRPLAKGEPHHEHCGCGNCPDSPWYVVANMDKVSQGKPNPIVNYTQSKAAALEIAAQSEDYAVLTEITETSLPATVDEAAVRRAAEKVTNAMDGLIKTHDNFADLEDAIAEIIAAELGTRVSNASNGGSGG